jgi:hypothetical protein
MMLVDIKDTYIIAIDNHVMEMCANNTSQVSSNLGDLLYSARRLVINSDRSCTINKHTDNTHDTRQSQTNIKQTK